MRKILSIISAALLLPVGLTAQQDISEIRSHYHATRHAKQTSILASDEFGGRETGTEAKESRSILRRFLSGCRTSRSSRRHLPSKI